MHMQYPQAEGRKSDRAARPSAMQCSLDARDKSVGRDVAAATCNQYSYSWSTFMVNNALMIHRQLTDLYYSWAGGIYSCRSWVQEGIVATHYDWSTTHCVPSAGGTFQKGACNRAR